MSRVYLCLDFHTFRSKGMDKTVFSTGLEDQFKNIPESRGIDFDDFVRSRFVLKDACMYVSYPNFERDVRYIEKSKGRFYNNVAIRLPQDGENDLVLMGDIYEMGDLVHHMVKDAVGAYVQVDLDMAAKVIRRDDKADASFNRISGEIANYIAAHPNDANTALDLFMITKYLERFGDHAVNIAEWVEFLKTGMHKSAQIV